MGNTIDLDYVTRKRKEKKKVGFKTRRALWALGELKKFEQMELKLASNLVFGIGSKLFEIVLLIVISNEQLLVIRTMIFHVKFYNPSYYETQLFYRLIDS